MLFWIRLVFLFACFFKLRYNVTTVKGGIINSALERTLQLWRKAVQQELHVNDFAVKSKCAQLLLNSYDGNHCISKCFFKCIFPFENLKLTFEFLHLFIFDYFDISFW